MEYLRIVKNKKKQSIIAWTRQNSDAHKFWFGVIHIPRGRQANVSDILAKVNKASPLIA